MSLNWEKVTEAFTSGEWDAPKAQMLPAEGALRDRLASLHGRVALTPEAFALLAEELRLMRGQFPEELTTRNGRWLLRALWPERLDDGLVGRTPNPQLERALYQWDRGQATSAHPAALWGCLPKARVELGGFI